MAVLVFDGECGFCRRRVEWLRTHAKAELDIIAWQEADLGSFDLTKEQCQERVQWVSGFDHASGGAAIARCLQECRQPWRTLGSAMRLPGIRSLAELGYRVVAANRGRLNF
jgi:predicted DCC family thiol-disulfide oxidoreductase YuxK